MSKSDPIQFLQAQKSAIDEKIGEISGRCNVLRERRNELTREKAGLLETPVTVDDFIDCVGAAIRKKKALYPKQLIRTLRNDAYQSALIDKPTFSKMTNETIMATAAAAALAIMEQPNSPSLAALFYVVNDLLVEGFAQALKEGLRNGKEGFANGKPMKEIMARIAEIDSEVAQIDAEI